MNESERADEMEWLIAELRQMLSGPPLPPDVRARCLASMLDAHSADKALQAAKRLPPQ
jgi:hypothetical protein